MTARPDLFHKERLLPFYRTTRIPKVSVEFRLCLFNKANFLTFGNSDTQPSVVFESGGKGKTGFVTQMCRESRRHYLQKSPKEHVANVWYWPFQIQFHFYISWICVCQRLRCEFVLLAMYVSSLAERIISIFVKGDEIYICTWLFCSK